jgi:hypothetical protein
MRKWPYVQVRGAKVWCGNADIVSDVAKSYALVGDRDEE